MGAESTKKISTIRMPGAPNPPQESLGEKAQRGSPTTHLPTSSPRLEKEEIQRKVPKRGGNQKKPTQVIGSHAQAGGSGFGWANCPNCESRAKRVSRGARVTAQSHQATRNGPRRLNGRRSGGGVLVLTGCRGCEKPGGTTQGFWVPIPACGGMSEKKGQEKEPQNKKRMKGKKNKALGW